MSIRNPQSTSIGARNLDRAANPLTFPVGTPDNKVWTRNPSWLSLTPVTSVEQKLRGLFAVLDTTNNYVAFVAQGDYTVDWGDGNVNNYSSNSKASHYYDYTDSNLSGTNAPVTFDSVTNTVNRASHGYSDGIPVTLYNISGTTGISNNQQYYVVNSTTNSFQISTSIGGSVVTLTGNGTGTLLAYKQAIITITPQAGQNLTYLDLDQIGQPGSAVYPDTTWLDIEVGSPNFTSFWISNHNYYWQQNWLERVAIRNLGSVTSLNYAFGDHYSLADLTVQNASYLTDIGSICNYCHTLRKAKFENCGAITNCSGAFLYCYLLQTVQIDSTQNVTDMSYMFSECHSIIEAPWFDTSSVQNFSQMFYSCSSLTYVPLYDTSAATDASGMFGYCYSLEQVPSFQFSSLCTDLHGFFSHCYSLKTAPYLNTSSVQNFSQMFSSCSNLKTIPKYDTSSGQYFDFMFWNDAVLTHIPLINTQSAVSMYGMFRQCTNLKTVPLLDTANVTNMSYMFDNCKNFVGFTANPTISNPFDTSSVTSMRTMFQECIALRSVPDLNTANVTDMGYMFYNCRSLERLPHFSNTSNVTTFEYAFLQCRNVKLIPAFSLQSIVENGIDYLFAYSSSIQVIGEIDFSNITLFNYCFDGNYALSRIRSTQLPAVSWSIRNCSFSADALNEVYTNLPVVNAGQTLDVYGNYGISGHTPSIATAKGWTILT